MKRKGKVTLGLLGAVAVLGGGSVVVRGDSSGGDGPRSIVVERGTVQAKALAVGTVEPEVEITVKSKVSGVVQRAFAEEGDYVEAGAPLLEIRPDPTPLELVEARRALELREIEVENLRRERDRIRALHERGLAPDQERDASERAYNEAALQLTTARERLQLLETGRVTSEKGTVESVVRSPITGYVLERIDEEEHEQCLQPECLHGEEVAGQ